MNSLTMLKTGAISLLLAAPAFAADTYKTDPGHTEVRFGWDHAGVSMQHGEFTAIDGTLVLDQDNPEASTLNVTIDPASVSTGVPALDDHIRTKDFLEVETYPEITFQSTGIKRTGDETAEITGDLTMHGMTKPIVLETTMTHLGAHPIGQFFDYYKGDWAAFSARAELDPGDWGVGSAIPVGKVFIEISSELKATN